MSLFSTANSSDIRLSRQISAFIPPPVTSSCSLNSFNGVGPKHRSFVWSEKSTDVKSENSELISSSTSPEKRVCFADSNGLALVTIRSISPRRSRDKLTRKQRSHRKVSSAVRPVFIPQTELKFLSCEFPQPVNVAGFDERLNTEQVCLERVLCSNFALLGTVKVKNLAYEKKVTVRVSLDCWKTYRDIWADYEFSCADGKADKFIFRVSLPAHFAVDQNIEFAIRYRARGLEFWDNNSTKNYRVQCLKITTSTDCFINTAVFPACSKLLEL